MCCQIRELRGTAVLLLSLLPACEEKLLRCFYLSMPSLRETSFKNRLQVRPKMAAENLKVILGHIKTLHSESKKGTFNGSSRSFDSSIHACLLSSLLPFGSGKCHMLQRVSVVVDNVSGASDLSLGEQETKSPLCLLPLPPSNG